MHKLRLLRIFLRSLFDTRPTDMVHPVTCRFMVSPFDVELTHASSHAYMAFAGLGRWSWNFADIDLRRMLRERWTPFTHSELVFYRRAAGKRIPIDRCSKGVQPALPAVRPDIVNAWAVAAVEFKKGA